MSQPVARIPARSVSNGARRPPALTESYPAPNRYHGLPDCRDCPRIAAYRHRSANARQVGNAPGAARDRLIAYCVCGQSPARPNAVRGICVAYRRYGVQRTVGICNWQPTGNATSRRSNDCRGGAAHLRRLFVVRARQSFARTRLMVGAREKLAIAIPPVARPRAAALPSDVREFQRMVRRLQRIEREMQSTGRGLARRA